MVTVDPRPRRASRRGWLAFGLLAAAAYVGLSVLVDQRVTQPLDDDVVRWLRPDDEWTWRQAVLGWVIDFFEPRRTLVFLAITVGLVARLRRSWRPVAFAATTVAASVVLIWVTKVLLARPDPHQAVSDTGGSYPSGHIATFVVAMGVVVMLQPRPPRRWHWGIVAAGGGIMAFPLLFGAAHWLTDVLGGALLAVTVLALTSQLPWRWTAPVSDAPAEGASVGRTVASVAPPPGSTVGRSPRRTPEG